MTGHVTPAATPSPIAERIGAGYRLDDVSTYLVGGPWPLAELTQRAELRQLVAFQTSDQQWAFPAWGFDARDGRLEIRPHVVALWQRLPHDGVLTDVDLAAWMNTEFGQLEGTPASYVAEHGYDTVLAAAVSRLYNRAVG